MIPAPHAAPAEAVAAALRSDPVRGLGEDEAVARLAGVVPRERAPRWPAYGRIAVRQLGDPLVALLVAAAGVSAAIGDGIEAAVIGAIVLLNGALGFGQEARAERALYALRERVARRAAVVREGAEREVLAAEVVPGDLIALREGDRVAADGRLVLEEGLACDEALLTGESVPAEKQVEPVAEQSPLGDRASMVFAGTWVVRGRARALAVAVGEATEEGRVADLAERARPPRTPLQRRLAGLTRAMVAGGVLVAVAIGGGLALRGSSLHEAFLVGVAAAVAAVPEGLAATVTIALALGARAMAARGALVRRLVAVETLGEATAICTDKTGTLTENSLRVAEVLPAPGATASDLLGAAALASSVEALDGSAPERVRDPLERAILAAAAERGVSADVLRRGRRLVRELPFDARTRRMAAVWEEPSGRRVVVKGAPESLLDRSAVDEAERRRLAALAQGLAERGGRVLAVAERSLPDGASLAGEVDTGLRPLGLLSLHDPLRPAARAAVAEARSAGISVVMATGDHPATARAVGRELGLPETQILARVAPAEKLELVAALQARGETVAVTGDGVNDAPALRRADVGVAMGRSGTEAAREAADVVLVDDDFSTIVAAVREGRRIADNLRTFVTFLLSANLGEVFLFAVCVLGGLGVPMTVVQVLTVNVLTDGLPAVALSRDRIAPDAMSRGPRRGTSLLDRRHAAGLVALGLLVGLAALGAYLAGRRVGHEEAQTMAYATIALAELALVFSLRAGRRPAWRGSWNALLAFGVASSALLVVGSVAVAGLREAFGTVALTGAEVALVAALAVLPAALVELGKAVLIRSS